jgi:hypothetical protein
MFDGGTSIRVPLIYGDDGDIPNSPFITGPPVNPTQQAQTSAPASPSESSVTSTKISDEPEEQCSCDECRKQNGEPEHYKTPAKGLSDHELLHRLWMKAVGTPYYDKEDFRELEHRFHRAQQTREELEKFKRDYIPF